MSRAFISFGAAIFVAFSIWLTIAVLTPTLYVETAFVIILYPSIASGIVTALALWASARKRRV
ncbi:hypothetical protein ABIB42_001180 [Massilia sp. UYP32]|jgi:hypothetical protein|uniref:hypothetical protein n=1 Tax=Massilia TaxID=149698 RepID=UPI00269BC207|nr:hypothetical protein [Massilia timonae]